VVDVEGGGGELALQRRDLGAGEGLRFLETKWYDLSKNAQQCQQKQSDRH
jgi:hypothetical protein